MTASEYHLLLLARLESHTSHSLRMADEAGERGDKQAEAWWRTINAQDEMAEEMVYQLDPQWFILNRAIYKSKS
jgi:hypothetical protein